MFKLWRLKRYLRRLDDPCLWLSGGKDSTLLLEVMIAERLKFSIICFQTGWTRSQRAVVDALTIKHDLRIYSYPPINAVMVGSGDGDLALISSYAVGPSGEAAQLISDIVPGPRCAFDVPLDTARSVTPPVTFGTIIVGTKKGESHFAHGGVPFLETRRWNVGSVGFAAPLFSWSDADVVKTLRQFGTEWAEPADEKNGGNIACCTACLQPREGGMAWCIKEHKPIPIVKWSATGNLADYQAAIGIRSV